MTAVITVTWDMIDVDRAGGPFNHLPNIRGVFMFRAVILASALLTAPAFASDRPAFDFMGLSTRDNYAAGTMLGPVKCKVKGAGEEGCTRPTGGLVGTVPVVKLTAKFNDGKLFLISGNVHIADFEQLKMAFISKYGKPTVTEDMPWRNPMPVNFSNKVVVWKFSDGNLKLRVRADDRDFSSFTFISPDHAPEKYLSRQPVNF